MRAEQRAIGEKTPSANYVAEITNFIQLCYDNNEYLLPAVAFIKKRWLLKKHY